MRIIDSENMRIPCIAVASSNCLDVAGAISLLLCVMRCIMMQCIGVVNDRFKGGFLFIDSRYATGCA